MKRIITLLAVVGMFSLQSCTPDDNFDSDTISEVFEVNPSFTQANGFSVTYALDPVIFSSDNILIYELVDTADGIDTWALLPQVYYFNLGSAQYNYNFSYDQFTVFIDSDFDSALLPSDFRLGKTFRIVIVPGDFSAKSTAAGAGMDYKTVIKTYKIDDSNVKVLK